MTDSPRNIECPTCEGYGVDPATRERCKTCAGRQYLTKEEHEAR